MLKRVYRKSFRYRKINTTTLSTKLSLLIKPSYNFYSAISSVHFFSTLSTTSIKKMADNENTTEATTAVTAENGVQDPVTGEIVSKNELKRRIKAREKEKEKAEKAAAKAEKEAAAQKTKDNSSSSTNNAAAEEELDPSKYVIYMFPLITNTIFSIFYYSFFFNKKKL